MELKKKEWTINDQLVFSLYLKSYEQKDKEVWSRNILQTKLEVLCIPTKTMYRIADEIFEGNYRSFLDLQIFDDYESIAIYGKLISKMKHFDEMVHYLTVYLDVMENWAHCDLLSFDINSSNQDQFLSLSHAYLQDQRTFVRRLGLMILLQMVKDESVLPVIYDRIKKLKHENEYYVIMMAGWLLSECLIRYREQTLDYLSREKELNPKIVNKGIQKCRESRRMTDIEKDQLLQYKRKK
jgi:3-methyladenine DNA glycosylase AlkD